MRQPACRRACTWEKDTWVCKSVLLFFSFVPCCLFFCCSHFSLSLFLITFSLVSHSLLLSFQLLFSICLLLFFIAVDLFLSLCSSCALYIHSPGFSPCSYLHLIHCIWLIKKIIKTWIRNVPWIQSICLYNQLFVLCLVIISFKVVCQFVSYCSRLTFCCFLFSIWGCKNLQIFFCKISNLALIKLSHINLHDHSSCSRPWQFLHVFSQHFFVDILAGMKILNPLN